MNLTKIQYNFQPGVGRLLDSDQHQTIGTPGLSVAVAKRWQERKASTIDGSFRGMLAGLRYPERVFYFDNGDNE